MIGELLFCACSLVDSWMRLAGSLAVPWLAPGKTTAPVLMLLASRAAIQAGRLRAPLRVGRRETRRSSWLARLSSAQLTPLAPSHGDHPGRSTRHPQGGYGQAGTDQPWELPAVTAALPFLSARIHPLSPS